jgi:3',5'-cyclic AMP phosphodiesterase CpdA
VTLRIAHLSDIHFGGELPDAVEAAVAFLATFDPTLIIITGDLTLNGTPDEFRAAARWLSRLPTPRLVTPGNHDTPYWNLLLRAVVPFQRYSRYIGAPASASYDGSGLVARCLNSARGAQPRFNWSRGAISRRDLGRLDWRSPRNGDVRIFACHHPLMDIEGELVAGGVRHGIEAMTDLSAAGVNLVLTGHLHNPFVRPLPGWAADAWAIGAGTLSRRLRGTPAGFTTITIQPDAFSVEALAWLGGGYETFERWRLPRSG